MRATAGFFWPLVLDPLAGAVPEDVREDFPEAMQIAPAATTRVYS
jgi:hypothetical protein